MSALDFAWIRNEVIRGYHWTEWNEDPELGVPANERHGECEPGWVPDEPYSASLCFCVRRMGVLVGPGRIRKDWSQGYPYRHHQVWLAHARDLPRIAEHVRQEEEAELLAAPSGIAEQLDLFAEQVSA